MIGTYKIVPHRSERQHSDIERAVGDGDMAGNMVLGVSEWEAEAEGVSYDSGGEDVRGWGC